MPDSLLPLAVSLRPISYSAADGLEELESL